MIENIRLAFQGIWSHKLRSVLTMLGIIIGIAAIIIIVSTIKGTNEQIKENLIGAGNNVVTVQLNQGGYQYDLSWNGNPSGVRTITQETREELEKLSAPAAPAVPEVPNISIDDFAKVKLICAKVLECEKVEKSDKLLKLQLDDGSGKERTIVSSIKEEYTPEELIGNKIIVVANF